MAKLSKFEKFVRDSEDEELLLCGDYEESVKEPRYPEGLTVEKVDQHGGGEGQGEIVWCVYRVTEEDANEYKHYRLLGWYSSYDGSHLDKIEEVFPGHVMKIQWVTKKPSKTSV